MRKRRAGLPLSRERGRVKRIANLSIPFPRKRESSIDIARKSGKQRASPPFSKITLHICARSSPTQAAVWTPAFAGEGKESRKRKRESRKRKRESRTRKVNRGSEK